MGNGKLLLWSFLRQWAHVVLDTWFSHHVARFMEGKRWIRGQTKFLKCFCSEGTCLNRKMITLFHLFDAIASRKKGWNASLTIVWEAGHLYGPHRPSWLNHAAAVRGKKIWPQAQNCGILLFFILCIAAWRHTHMHTQTNKHTHTHTGTHRHTYIHCTPNQGSRGPHTLLPFASFSAASKSRKALCYLFRNLKRARVGKTTAVSGKSGGKVILTAKTCNVAP